MTFEKDLKTLSPTEFMEKYYLTKQRVKEAIEIALPAIVIGGRVPSDEVMKFWRASREFLFEELGLEDEE